MDVRGVMGTVELRVDGEAIVEGAVIRRGVVGEVSKDLVGVDAGAGFAWGLGEVNEVRAGVTGVAALDGVERLGLGVTGAFAGVDFDGVVAGARGLEDLAISASSRYPLEF